jgi:putative DNA primase/helicase
MEAMMQSAVGREWLEEVKAEVSKWKDASPKEQREICNWVGRVFGAEAARAAEQLLAEAAPKPTDGVSFRDEQAKADDDEAPLLSKASPYDSAKEFVKRYCFKEGVLATYYWGGNFWQWNRRYYEILPDSDINRDVWAFLHEAKSGTKGDSGRFRPKPADVEGVIKALKAGLTMSVDPPCWLDGRGAENILVFKNGLVDIESGTFLKPDPRLWIHHGVDYEYDLEAECPAWDRFLDEVFESDPESRDCIEEQLGLGMTNDVRLNKGFLWIGLKGREGKSTLAHMQGQLCGSGAYVSLAFPTWLRGEYSSEVMLGKKVGVFPDVRLKEGKWYGQNFDAGGLDHVSKEMLLRITGADGVTIYRKWNSVPWRGVLPMKVILISNKIPYLNDHILVTRFITIAFNVSFRDREDILMREKLEAELPGIANRCLAAYRRLRERGAFIQPPSGLELAKEVARNSYPFQAFMEDRCELDRDGSIRPIVMLFQLHEWCKENGEADLLRRVTTASHLSRALKEYIQNENIQGLNTKTFRAHGDDRVWFGLRLKTKAKMTVTEPMTVVTEKAKIALVKSDVKKSNVGGFRRI